MIRSTVAVTGTLGQSVKLPSWGQAFWQDPNNGELVVLFASGTTEVDYAFSADSGNTWSAPSVAFYVDDFSIHDNFDTAMDPGGNIHCAHRFSGSGCYSFLAKNYISGGWAPSGIIGRGFVAVSDAGPAKGFNGSIELTPSPVGITFLDVTGPFPVARIVAKNSSNEVDSWWVPNPFVVFPKLDTFVGTAKGVFPAGAAGGYPLFSASGPVGRQIIYSVDATGICQIGRTFGSASIRVIPVKDPTVTFDEQTLEGSGYYSRVPLGPSMSFLKTNVFAGPPSARAFGNQEFILTSSKYNDLTGFEILTASFESQLSNGLDDSFGNISNYLGRIPSVGTYAAPFGIDDQRAVNGVPINNANETLGGIIQGDTFSRSTASGTLSDMSWGSEDNTVNLYFLITEPNGEQSISRIFCETTRDFVGGVLGGQNVNPLRATYSFSSLKNATSGIHAWAPATREYTGGSGTFLTWNNFKAVHHSARQFEKPDKIEAVVTQGSGLDGISRIVFWDFANSIDATAGNIKQTTFVQHRTLDSGNNPNFTGPSARVGLTGPEVDILFNDSTSTGVTVASGDSVTLEFPTQQIFNRFEVAWNDPFNTANMFEINVDASLDGVKFTRVLTIPEGEGTFAGGNFLIKASSEFDSEDVDLDGTIGFTMIPFVARFVKVSFTGVGVGTRDVREIRLYGAHNTAGGWQTAGFSKLFFRPDEVNFGRVETFGTVVEGSIPVDWKTYGDFNWFVRASGGGQSGFAKNGSIYQGTTNGRNDGFAARTSETGVLQIPSGVVTSGVLEVDINVPISEVAFDGTSGRTIAFDIRYDTVTSSPSITVDDPTDDQVIFQTISATGIQTVRYPARFPVKASEFCGTTVCPEYSRYRTTVPTGNVTLRWIYQRGTLNAPSITLDETSVWLDNVQGAGTILQNTIAGYVKGSTFFASGSINAFLNKALTKQFPAYIRSDDGNISSLFNAYVRGVNFASGSVNSYIYGKLTESVNAFVNGNRRNVKVNAYLLNSGKANSVFGYIGNRANQGVNAYLLNNGVGKSVNAFILVPEFKTINAYLAAPTLATGNVNAYLKANGYQDTINAYILGSGLPTGSINAYIFNNGIGNSENGFMTVGDSAKVAAYVGGAVPISGGINAWISGVDVTSNYVNAYLAGISGSASGSMNAYVMAVEAPNGKVNGFIIGFGGDEQCNFPLVLLPTITIPSGNFFG